MSLQESEDVEPRKNIAQVMKELKNVSDDTSIQIVNVSSEDGVDSYAIYYNSIKYGIICNSDNNGKTTMAIMQMEESKDSSSIDFTFLLSDIMQAIDDTNKDSYLQVINTIYDGESEYNGVRYFTTGSGELKNITFYAEW